MTLFPTTSELMVGRAQWNDPFNMKWWADLQEMWLKPTWYVHLGSPIRTLNNFVRNMTESRRHKQLLSPSQADVQFWAPYSAGAPVVFSLHPFLVLSSCQIFLASHFHTDWLSWLGLGNQVGLTTDYQISYYLPSTLRDLSTISCACNRKDG